MTTAARDDRPTHGVSDATTAWLDHVELFLVGLCMASSMDPSNGDPQDDFTLWAKAWPALRSSWDLRAGKIGWHRVGVRWEHHAWR